MIAAMIKKLTSIDKNDYDTRGINVLDSILPNKYYRVELYILTYTFTPVEYITKSITQEIYAFDG